MSKRKSPSSKSKGEGSEHYTVLARKYRPSNFDDLIGQDAMVQTLRNAFATGRIAQAYMLTGVRGVGKTTTARILARAFNYTGREGDQGPTVELNEIGEHCEAIMESRHVDVLEMDAASHTGVDNIREIIESARYKPVSARTKIYIIDEVHMLSKGAFNALLKTLEEPPDHVKFIFATTEIRKVPVTVLSRCQRFDLKRVSGSALAEHFAKIARLEKVAADDEALQLIATTAGGSVRDGLSILDQAIALSEGKVTADHVRSMLGLADSGRIFDLLETVFKGDASEALARLDKIYGDGAEPGQILGDMADAVHVITRTKVAGLKSNDQSMSEQARNRASDLSNELSIPVLARAWQMLLKGIQEVNTSNQQLAAAEMVLVRMSYVSELPTPEDIIKGAPASPNRPDNGTGKPPSGGQSGAHIPSGENSNQDTRRVLAVNAGQENSLPETKTAPDQDAEPANNLPQLNCLQDIVDYAGRKRDAKLKIDLENYARLVNFRRGSIEIGLADGAPKNLANDLGQKLTDWTGERWIVSVSGAPGEKTLSEQRQDLLDAEIALVKEHPLVQEVLEQFPNAEITSVVKSDSDSEHD